MERTYNITIYIILPLLLMIGICFLCGFVLAAMEGPGEIQKNNKSLQKWFNNTLTVESMIPSMQGAYQECLEQFKDESLSIDDLLSFIDECTKAEIETQKKNAEKLTKEAHDEQLSTLKYNWVVCSDEETPREHGESGIAQWKESYDNLEKAYLLEGFTPDEARNRAISEADGSENCVLNGNAAALFWYTVMTTIGYGNTAPVTTSGRILVAVVGFFHLCIFVVIVVHRVCNRLSMSEYDVYRITKQLSCTSSPNLLQLLRF